MQLTKNAPAPAIYRKWAARSVVGGAMTRRCWFRTEQGPIYPNSMTLCVGNASTGKGPAIDPAERLLQKIDTTGDPLRQFDSIHLGPGDATVAGLFDEFIDEKTQRTYTYKGEKTIFSPVIVIAEELSAFMHHVDMQMMGYLIKFLNGQSHSQRLRSKGERITVEFPLLHVLGGVQPKVLSQIFPAQAFGMGLTARTIFVYSNEITKVSPFSTIKIDENLEDDLAHDLNEISKLTGPFKIIERAQDKIENWWMHESDRDKQNHPKLEGYNGKRILHLFRLCMIHSAARGNSMIITLSDVESALSDLLEVEKQMPRIFEDMSGDDAQEDIFADIAHQFLSEFIKTKKPIPYHVLTKFVARKAKSYEIVPIIEAMVTQQIIIETRTTVKVPGGGPKAFIPGPTIGEV